MDNPSLPPYLVLEKAIGETPLSCVETYRITHPELIGIPLAYAGRLDPMASGKLLVLVGDECKQQNLYHELDKEYQFSVLFGITSDTQDVLGRLQACQSKDSIPPESDTNQTINTIIQSLIGPIELSYPHFSAKTVHGKPLHTWTLENRLHEITIPTRKSIVYELEHTKTEQITRQHTADTARSKIDTIPTVTDSRKALGNDFRRVDVRRDWEQIRQDATLPETYQIAHFRCVASSGTYMRSLAEIIGKKSGSCGLAWHIHRTKIGKFDPKTHTWSKCY
jgi:tRNA pseudouridine(55) synthase